MQKQRTIKQEISPNRSWTPYRKGCDANIQTCPENFGYAFIRVDLEGHPIIEADANFVVNTQGEPIWKKEEWRFKPPNMFWQPLWGWRLIIAWSGWMLRTSHHGWFFQVLWKPLKSRGWKNKSFSWKNSSWKSNLLYWWGDGQQITVILRRIPGYNHGRFWHQVLGTQNASLKHIADFKTEIADSRTFSFLTNWKCC